jgi:cell division protein FtsW
VTRSESRVDLLLIGDITALLCVGLVMVASASMSLAEHDFGGPLYYFWKQFGAIALGLGGAWLMVKVPTEAWERAGPALLVVAFALLCAVLVPGLGRSANGSTRWLRFAGMNLIQVSEPARLLFLMYICGYAVRRSALLLGTLQGFLRPLMLAGAASLLLLLQPDFGACLMLVAITLGVLFIAGARLRDFVASLGLVFVVGALVAIASPYRVARLTSFVNPWADPFNRGFQLVQSLIAIGTGEWFGLGLGGSVQKLFYLPEAHTDFVYAVIAEEFGLLGSFIMIALFAILTWRALVISRDAARLDRAYASYLAFGIGVWQGVQAFINMGVNMGILPTKGLTLPLVSYGRSSVLVTLVALGILLRIDLENRGTVGAARRRPSAQRVAS